MSDEQDKVKEYEEKTKQTISDSTLAASRLRLNAQSALMISISDLLTKIPARESPPVGYPVPRINKVYDNFAIFRTNESNGIPDSVRGDEVFGGGHISLTNRLLRSESTKLFFKDIPSNILSGLLPSIKLYKEFYLDSEKTDPSKSFVWRIPFDELSYKMKGADQNVSEFIATTEDIDNLLGAQGRGHSVGIKSFRYSYVGTNPAEVNTNISAELELFFQDVRDLIKEIDVNKNHPNFEGKNRPDDSFQTQKFSYSNLIVDEPRKKFNKASKKLEINPAYFRLKIITGYAQPSAEYWENIKTANLYTDLQIENFKKAVNNAQVILYLNPYSHDINFQEDGSITVKIQYIAAMTSIMADLDVLAITDEKYYENFNAAKRDYEEQSESFRQKIDEIKNCGLPQGEREKQVADKEKELREQLFQAENELENNRNRLVSDFFNRLIFRKNLYSAYFSAEALGVNGEGKPLEYSTHERIKKVYFSKTLAGYAALTPQEAQADKSIYLAKSVQEIPTPKTDQGFVAGAATVGRAVVNFFSIAAISEAALETPPVVPDVNSKETAANKMKEIEEESRKSQLSIKDKDGKFEVKFVFLGDLFDIACEVIEKQIKDPKQRPRIILNDLTIQIPTSFSTNDPNNIYDTNAINNTITFNIADIPISLDMLQQFIFEKIVNKKKNRYPLITFLNDIMTDIVSPSISPSMFGKNAVFNNSVRMSSLNLSIPFIGDRDIFTRIHKNYNFVFKNNYTDTTGLLKESQISLEEKIKIADELHTFYTGDFGKYFIIYCSSQLPNLIKNGNGDEKIDEKNGVYHIRIGSDKGILKKMNFSRVDMPFYKEARAQAADGTKGVTRMRDVYDISINLFGNNIFRPGDFIYVEPLIFVGKEAIQLQNKLGIGGYYQVTEVSTSITENVFETSLKTVLAGYIEENGTTKKVTAENNSKNC